MTAVQPGRYKVAWQVAAGLNGKAWRYHRGALPAGDVHGQDPSAPPQSYVNNTGQVVTTQ